MGLTGNVVRALKHRLLRRRLAARLDKEPVTVAQILLLFRMILADGVIRDREMAAFAQICHEHFGIENDEMAALHSYLERRQLRDGEPEARDAILKGMAEGERLRLIGLMGRIAAASGGIDADAPDRLHEGDGARAASDRRFIRDTAVALGVADGQRKQV